MLKYNFALFEATATAFESFLSIKDHAVKKFILLVHLGILLCISQTAHEKLCPEVGKWFTQRSW